MLLALAGVSSVAMAQQKTEVVEEFGVIQVQDKYQVITNPFWSNWFFSIGGGAEATFGDNDKAGSFGKRISPTLNFAIGKWFTPGLGVRLQYSGLQARGYTYDAGADYVKGTQMDDGYYKQRFDYMNLHGDVMFNLNALFGGYNQHRVYEIIPYVGAGFTHNYTKPHREALSVNAGIINRFRISNAIDINLELSAMGVEDKFDGEVGGDHGYDGVLSATVGLTYRFPARRIPSPDASVDFSGRAGCHAGTACRDGSCQPAAAECIGGCTEPAGGRSYGNRSDCSRSGYSTAYRILQYRFCRSLST